jgi:hypothetical protein
MCPTTIVPRLSPTEHSLSSKPRARIHSHAIPAPLLLLPLLLLPLLLLPLLQAPLPPFLLL